MQLLLAIIQFESHMFFLRVMTLYLNQGERKQEVFQIIESEKDES